jgi:NACalpha-BTF3-like transcription factor|tara:strand:+ start:313 stop:501 length:189 start_codon:yes stop_codon:yes gene_type:complete
MFSQIVRINNGNIKLYINQSRAEHENVIRALIDNGYEPRTAIRKLSDKVFDTWYLYSSEVNE